MCLCAAHCSARHHLSPCPLFSTSLTPLLTLIFLIFAACSLSPISAHQVEKRQALVTFNDIVRQKTRGNFMPQCPCVLHPESHQCISYDSRYQASNVDEAILAFLDLHNHQYQAPIINSNSFQCNTLQCRTCFSAMFYRLQEVGLVQADYRPSIPLIAQTSLQQSLCPRFTFYVPPVIVAPPVNTPAYVSSMISAGESYRLATSGARALNALRSGTSNNPNFGRTPSRRNNQNQNQNSSPSQNHLQTATLNNAANAAQAARNAQLARQRQQQQNSQAQANQNQRNQRIQQQQRNLQLQQQSLRNRQNFQQQQRQQQRNLQLQQQQRNLQLQRAQAIRQQNAARQWQAARTVNQAGRNLIWNAATRQWLPRLGNQLNQQANSGVNPWNSNAWNAIQNAVQQPRMSNSNQGGQSGPWPPVQPQPVPTPSPWQPPSNPWQPPQTPGNNGGQNGGGNGWGWGGGGGWGWPGGGWPGGGGGNGNNNQNNDNGFGFGIIGRRNNKREKRQADKNLVGTRFTVHCTERGQVEDDRLSLCASCWTWRYLPEGYFPRLINEINCKEDYCLSGWGECHQAYRNVDVLRNVNGRWMPTVIATATCCDCSVRAGTEIHSLVTGNRR